MTVAFKRNKHLWTTVYTNMQTEAHKETQRTAVQGQLENIT